MDEGRVRRARRHRMLAALAVAALVVHGLALSGLRWVWPQADVAPAARPALRVRAVPGGPVALPLAGGSDGAAAPAKRHPPAPRRPSAPVTAAPPADRATPARATPAEASAAVPALVGAAEPPVDEAPPVYPTRLPPAATLHYRVQRGEASGTAELDWQPDGHHYLLRFDSLVGGAAVLSQVSEGEFDAAGVAPRRFVDRRGHRGAIAANFQRDAGRISFSGKATDAPLRSGSQDRLSWMLQLGAIVAADPALRRGGARVLIPVVSAAGDAAVWTFRCEAEGEVEPQSGTADTLHFVREPRGPYDTRAEVWLDPARHHLPVRAAWKSGPADEGFDLQLVIP